MTTPPFLRKLWEMVNDPNNEQFLSWRKDGDGFQVIQPCELGSLILPKYFNGTMCSFIRQLNLYGFSKVGDEFAFKHHDGFFKRGQENLLQYIERRKNIKSKNRSEPDKSGEPNKQQKTSKKPVKAQENKPEPETDQDPLTQLIHSHNAHDFMINYLTKELHQHQKEISLLREQVTSLTKTLRTPWTLPSENNNSGTTTTRPNGNQSTNRNFVQAYSITPTTSSNMSGNHFSVTNSSTFGNHYSATNGTISGNHFSATNGSMTRNHYSATNGTMSGNHFSANDLGSLSIQDMKITRNPQNGYIHNPTFFPIVKNGSLLPSEQPEKFSAPNGNVFHPTPSELLQQQQQTYFMENIPPSLLPSSQHQPPLKQTYFPGKFFPQNGNSTEGIYIPSERKMDGTPNSIVGTPLSNVESEAYVQTTPTLNTEYLDFDQYPVSIFSGLDGYELDFDSK